MKGGRERRLVFGEVAEQYDRARPGYPAAVFADALAHSGFRDGDWVLEVGAGTGKATAGYVGAGARVVALEPDADMARVARERFPDEGRVAVVEQTFEEWSGRDVDGDAGGGGGGRFALVAAAQSWHWMDPTARMAKAHAALRVGGAVALAWNQPRYPDTDLRRALDDTYVALAPDTQGRFARGTPRPLDGQEMAIDELQASERFDAFMLREYRHVIAYDADAYVALLETHSDHRMLAPGQRSLLLTRVAELVDAAGGVTVEYATTLALARRVG